MGNEARWEASLIASLCRVSEGSPQASRGSTAGLARDAARMDHAPSFFAKSAFARFTADIAFGQPT